MIKQAEDPGIGEKFTDKTKRVINKDGSFNVNRRGLKNVNVYQYLVEISWLRFLVIVFAGYIITNIIFASLYLSIGIQHLQGAEANTPMNAFLNAFFFSVHTFTTVGYGSISPKGVAANTIAAMEAAVGLMSFAIATGLLYGRFSRPSASLAFSGNAVVAPYRGITGLMFRIANLRTNVLAELEVKVLLMTVDKVNGQYQRKYFDLPLERATIHFLPLTWTIVHPINDSSPFFGRTEKEMNFTEVEIIIQVKGFDETFSQVVRTRYSYRYDEIIWNAKFIPAFHIAEGGDLILDIDKINNIEKLEGLQEHH